MESKLCRLATGDNLDWDSGQSADETADDVSLLDRVC